MLKLPALVPENANEKFNWVVPLFVTATLPTPPATFVLLNRKSAVAGDWKIKEGPTCPAPVNLIPLKLATRGPTAEGVKVTVKEQFP